MQGGIGFNLQQQLGPHSPFGWFGRFGFGGSQVSGGAKAQVGTGFVMNAPLKYAGWVPQLTNDLLGVGFVWSQPSATTKTVYHDNEYVFETFYTLQLSPTSVSCSPTCRSSGTQHSTLIPGPPWSSNSSSCLNGERTRVVECVIPFGSKARGTRRCGVRYRSAGIDFAGAHLARARGSGRRVV